MAVHKIMNVKYLVKSVGLILFNYVLTGFAGCASRSLSVDITLCDDLRTITSIFFLYNRTAETAIHV